MIIYRNEEFKRFNTLRVNNFVLFLFEVQCAYDIYLLVYLFNYFKIDYYVIGNGSKILFKEMIISKPIIVINNKYEEMLITNNKVFVSSGYSLSKFILNLAEKNLGGFHNLFCIPASIGGAICNNAGDSINEISRYIDKIVCLDKNAKIIIFNKNDCLFSYRKSIFKNNSYVILYALFNCDFIDKKKIFIDINNATLYRKLHQETNCFTCGSLFKNTDNYKAYELIKKTNMVSLNFNGAHLSKKHNNFLINDKQACSTDIIKLISAIIKCVYFKTGYVLELELIIL